MSHPIKTSELNPASVSTTDGTGESIPDWIARHNQLVSDSTPSGNTLTTTWTSASGPQIITTTRNPGESPKEFRLRHHTDYLVLMIEEPPIP
jgi:YD repeat-containing protein